MSVRDSSSGHLNGRVSDIQIRTGLLRRTGTVDGDKDEAPGVVITVEGPLQSAGGGGRIVDSTGTQLSLDRRSSASGRKLSSVSLQRCGWKLKYQDFVPERKLDGSRWESKENFQKLVDAANEWLRSNTDVQVKTCQTMTWMSRDAKHLTSSEIMVLSKSIAENTPTYFLRGLRLWLVPRSVNRLSTLSCTDFVPDITDSCIQQLIYKVNKKIENQQLKGDIVTVETVGIPVVNGSLNSRWTRWRESMDEDEPYAFYLRVFHVQEANSSSGKGSNCLKDIARIEIKDIVPVETEDGYEGFEDLVDRGNSWLKDQTNVAIVNLQSILVPKDIDNHRNTGSACFFQTPGINSPTAVDFFRILRMVLLKSDSAAEQTQAGVDSPSPSPAPVATTTTTTVHSFNYETFTPELVRLKESSAKERLEKMNEIFSKVIAYLRNSGVDVICAEMVSNPMQLLSPDGAASQYDEIQFLLTVRLYITGGHGSRWDGSMRSIKRASVASSSRTRNSPSGETEHPGPIFLKSVVSRRFQYRWLVLAISAISCMTVIVVVSVVYANR